MLGFLVSTIAFSVTTHVLNRYFNTQEPVSNTLSCKVLVMGAATFISMGAGWFVDKLDGSAKLTQRKFSIANVIQSGDPVQIVKMLTGID